MNHFSSNLRSIRQAIQDANDNGPALTLDYLTGYSGAKLLGVLQRITSCLDSTEIYCEIGVYQGLSLVSVAAANPTVTCVGIDNFAFFDPTGTNKSVIENRINMAGLNNVRLLESDYEESIGKLEEILDGRRVGALFIDGPHDYRSQLMCLLLFKKLLSANAVIVVDDCNYAHVRQANADFLRTNVDYKLIYEKYTYKHPNNMSDEERVEAIAGWWNGVNVLAHDLTKEIPQKLPITDHSRELYENEHELHAMRFADVAQDAVRFASSLRPLRTRLAVQRFRTLLRRLKRSKDSQLPFEELNMRNI